MLSAVESASVSRSVVSEPLWPPCTVQSARLLCPWGSPGKNTGVGSYSLLQEIFPTQVSNPGLSHCRRILYVWASDLKGVKPPLEFGERIRDCSSGHAGKALISPWQGRLVGFLELRRQCGVSPILWKWVHSFPWLRVLLNEYITIYLFTLLCMDIWGCIFS